MKLFEAMELSENINAVALKGKGKSKVVFKHGKRTVLRGMDAKRDDLKNMRKKEGIKQKYTIADSGNRLRVKTGKEKMDARMRRTNPKFKLALRKARKGGAVAKKNRSSRKSRMANKNR